MWPFGRKKTSEVFFTNTLSGRKEEFIPLTPGKALLYSCGPTVYGPLQIGNLRAFVVADLVARTLAAAGYEVKRVMNITDVGHMVADADIGEDKMSVGAKRDNTTPEAIAEKYAKVFMDDITALGVQVEKIRFPRATSYIKEDIEMIRALEKKGYAYKTSEGLYFDTAKFPEYGMLAGMKDAQLRAGARVDMGEKRSPHDFVLWRAAKQNDLQKWDSPWGQGNPGWSIECSAMATALLGTRIDLHTGGEDLATVHHNNEIAQSEGSSGKHPFVRYWLHNAFLTMGGEKLSKSAGNSFTLADVVAKGYHPLALRYLFLQAHYRSPLSFSWDSLAAADTALKRLWGQARVLRKERGQSKVQTPHLRDLAADDLNTPGIVSALHSFLAADIATEDKWRVIEEAEPLLGLSLTNPPTEAAAFALDDLPADIQAIAKEREEARKNKDFKKSDELRDQLNTLGYSVEDGERGPRFTRIRNEPAAW